MSDADAAPTQALRVLIRENELLPLGTIQSDILSAARLVGLTVWLGHAVLDPDDPQDDLLSPYALEGLEVRRIKYGSSPVIDFQKVVWAVSWAVSSTRTIFALMRGTGQVRLNFAKASESNAQRDLTYEQAATTRSERRSREYQEQIERLREVAENLRPELSDEDNRRIDHLINQAMLKPELLQDSLDAQFALSAKLVELEVVGEARGRSAQN